MPVAESEIVTGYITEYTGIRFLLFFIGEFATAGVFAALAATLFLGGWSLPVHRPRRQHHERRRPAGPVREDDARRLPDLLGAVHLPRFREDQLQAFAWKYLIPISLVNILATTGPEGGVLMPSSPSRSCPGLFTGLRVTFGELMKTMFPKGPASSGSSRRPRSAPSPCSTRTSETPAPAPVASSPSRRRTARSACCARAAAPTGASTSRATRPRPAPPAGGKARTVSAPRPVRHRLRALHVLRHLRRGLPVRRPVLEPRVRVLEPKLADLLHDKERLGEWMETVPDFEDYEAGVGGQGPQGAAADGRSEHLLLPVRRA